MHKYLLFFGFVLFSQAVLADNSKPEKQANGTYLKFIDQLTKDDLNIDSLKKKSKDQSAIATLIVKIDEKIKKLEREQLAEDEKEKSFIGKLTEGISNNFREQKLNYLKGIRNFLMEEQGRLEKIGSGVKKVLD